jgi:hypothetical protein
VHYLFYVHMGAIRLMSRFVRIFPLKFALGHVAWLLLCHNRGMSNDCRDYEADFKLAYGWFQDD